MPIATSIPRQTVGKTFIVAVSLLGIGALAQFAAVSWAFYSRFSTTPDLASSESSQQLGAPISLGDPFGDEHVPGEPIKPRPLLQSPYRPVPIVPETPAQPTPQSRFDELVNQARMLRDRGDTYTAITRLREAMVLDPSKALPLAEIAVTYEKMGMAEKAAEHWKKVYGMGESAGVYFAAAEAKMKATQAQAMLQAMPAPEPEQPTEALPSRSAAPGEIPQNAKLGLASITRQEVSGGPQAKFVLRVPVLAKPKARIDVEDVAIQVFFYDAVDGRALERTSAEVTTRWNNPPADWADGDEEILEVTYAQQPPAQGEPAVDRKFYGYVVRVYYKDALQDSRAEPARLEQQFPAPRTLAQPDPPQ